MSYGQLAVSKNFQSHASSLSERLDYEIKKQRLMFRYYRDYFGSSMGQEKLKASSTPQKHLRKIFEAIRQELRSFLYPQELKGTKSGHKYLRLMMIQIHLDQLEYIKNS